MQLNNSGLKNRTEWENAGYLLPDFDREVVRQKTQEAPSWIHFGAGNIFRAFQANLMQKLLNQGLTDTGLIVAEGFDYEIIEKMNRPHDDYSILVTLKADGNIEKTVIGSIVESFILDSQDQAEFMRLKEIFRSPSLQMVSFTITEKGYSLTDAKGQLLPAVARDFTADPITPESYIGKLTTLVYERFLAGELPIALVSMDNCSHNGSKLYEAVHAFAKSWCSAGLADSGFLSYVENPDKVSFPWTMIDKITPRPDPKVQTLLEKDKIEELLPVITGKNTYVAPFVNAEECEYLVIEDLFPNGRPPLEKAGVIFTDRDTVNRVEKMKVCTCLNPLHTTLAIFGCLLQYELISEEMKNPLLKKLVEIIGYKEGMPVVVNPGIIDPESFIREVLTVRIPNPFMPDTPQRIATDTSQKLPIRFGETLKAYAASDSLKLSDIKMIPLVFAGWLRYLLGVDDAGNTFTRSSDPMLDAMDVYLSRFRLGTAFSLSEAEKILSPILHQEKIWGIDLYDCGLSDKVLSYFLEMLEGTGAVERTLKKYLED